MWLQISLISVPVFLLFTYSGINSSEDKVSIQYNYYSSNSGQVVNSPSISISKSIFEKTSFEISYNVDAITSASWNHKDGKTHRNFSRNCSTCHSTVDAITGASTKFTDIRNEIGLGIKHGVEETTIEANYKYSKERDYFGQLFSGSITQDVNDGNTRIYLAYTKLNDKITPIWNSDTFNKSTDIYDLGVEQILTPGSIGKVGLSFSNSNGLLSNPYSRVNINDLPYLENHPDTKNRTTLSLMLNQYISNSSISLDYRYYTDSWEVSGNTIAIMYSQYIFDNLIVKPTYRFYTQTGAYFFKDIYNQQENFITHELILSPFSSHMFGLSINYFFTPEITINTGYFLYIQNSKINYSKFFQNEDLKSNIFQLGIDYKL